ncbi:YcaO-like family protein [Streptomyces sp. NPDC005195]|uniref:YcaO-like family protein n=1 Tax=Streptomyces sp. NPDC005195 TaxID=3154561 RepID=UPI0033BE0945
MSTDTEIIPLDGTVRARTPDDTWAALAPHLGRYGITRVADHTGLDHLGLPVWTAIRPAAHTLTASQGKGATDRLAAISAVMEAIELWHTEQPLTVDHRASARHVPLNYPLDALPLRVPPEDLKALRGFNLLPQEWTAGTGLITGQSLLVPSRLISRAPHPMWAPDIWRTTSTGLACGNSRDEALVHALCEVIERHTLYTDERTGGALRTSVDPATVHDPYARSLIDRLQHAHTVLELFVVDSAYALPVCLAYLWSEDYPAFFAGAGCHIDPHIALARAITEAAQSRLTCIAGLRDDLASRDEVLAAPQPLPPTNTRPHLRWDKATAATPAAVPASIGTFEDLVQLLAARLSKATGYEPIAVTLSQADEPLTAVKVIAPGTRSRTRKTIPR